MRVGSDSRYPLQKYWIKSPMARRHRPGRLRARRSWGGHLVCTPGVGPPVPCGQVLLEVGCGSCPCHRAGRCLQAVGRDVCRAKGPFAQGALRTGGSCVCVPSLNSSAPMGRVVCVPCPLSGLVKEYVRGSSDCPTVTNCGVVLLHVLHSENERLRKKTSG